MAALNIQISAPEVSSNVTSAAKTQIAVVSPANQRVKIRGFSAWGKGTSNTDSPVKIELMTANTISGGTGGTVTSSKVDGDTGESIQSTITGAYSVEPTYGSPVTIRTYEVHPQTGIEIYFPNDFMPILKGNTGFSIRTTSVQTETMSFQLYIEE